MTTLFPSMGQIAVDSFDKILDILSKKSSVDSATRADIVDGFKLWSLTCQLPAKTELLKIHSGRLFDSVATLAQANDTSSTTPYKGDVYAASVLAEALDNFAKMDPSQEVLVLFAPAAYNALEAILSNKALDYEVKTPMKSEDTINTRRGEVLSSLLGVLPYSKEVIIPNSIPLISSILKSSYPESIKAKARSSLQSMKMINQEGVVNAGADLIDLIKLGGNDDLFIIFASVPAVYFNKPAAIHDNIGLFLNANNFRLNASLLNNVASRHPEVLVPHVSLFIQQLSSTELGAMVLSILDNIAAKDPKAVYAHKATVLTKGKLIQMGEFMIARILGKLAVVPNTADECFEDILKMMDVCQDQNALTSMFAEISNVMVLVSSRDKILNNLSRMERHKTVSSLLFKEIDDYAHGRSLKEVTLRVDILDAKVNALNTKVAETCTNMADVLAYVDANMADMKDFLAQVTKRLPQPKRLEIVGTLRKTLILHFECCRTGMEFPITSHDWSKWLKMGFSLVKAGQAIIDLGMGNPLGILKKGIECVQEVYEAYKTNDDDEFNSYITNPFLLSSEQDQLLEKLRAQGFFDIFAYDAQVASWYMLNPEKDGRRPEAVAGSVTKAWTKKGYGITEGLVAAAEGATGIQLSDMLPSSLSPGPDSKDKEFAGNSTKSSGTASLSPMETATGVSGGNRAAAMREQFGSAANRSADEKLGEANRSAAYQEKVDVLQGEVAELEKKIAAMSTSIEELRNRPAGCTCVIS
jgi:hypothetical protein